MDSPHQRAGVQPQALNYSFEKSGLVLDGQPIPWNADAVLVEARLRLPHFHPGLKNEFSLRVAGQSQSLPPENLVLEEPSTHGRLFFRIPVPDKTTFVEVFWRERSLGQMTIPRLGPEEFQRSLTLTLSGLSVRLDDQSVACQSCVVNQAKEVIAAAVLTSATSLAPIVELGLHVRLEGGPAQEFPVVFSNSQLRGRQALVTAMLPRPRRTGDWQVHWMIGGQTLGSHRLRFITQAQFLRSLRLSATRFLTQDAEGKLNLVRTLPERADFTRAGPVFWVSSSHVGMAGLASFQVLVHKKDGSVTPIPDSPTVLISDGPAAVAAGTLAAADLEGVRHFELRGPKKSLGILPLDPAPAAQFTSEGGFQEVQDFTWSATADDILRDKLGKLMGGK